MGYDNKKKNNNNSSKGSDEYVKHSGAKMGTDVNGKQYIRGWNYSKAHGMVVYYCTPWERTKVVKSKTGKQVGTEYANWLVTVQRKNLPDVLTSGMVNVNKKIITLNAYGMVINPNAKNGGYCGTFVNND